MEKWQLASGLASWKQREQPGNNKVRLWWSQNPVPVTYFLQQGHTHTPSIPSIRDQISKCLNMSNMFNADFLFKYFQYTDGYKGMAVHYYGTEFVYHFTVIYNKILRSFKQSRNGYSLVQVMPSTSVWEMGARLVCRDLLGFRHSFKSFCLWQFPCP